MDAEGFQDKTYLRRYYAGQAIVGLLANRRPLLKKPGAGDIEQLAKEAFIIADAMVEAVGHNKPKAGAAL